MTNEIETQEPVKTTIADTVVSFKCTADQKALLVKKAVEECGLTVSEFIKYKVFNDNPIQQTQVPDVIQEVLPDDEKAALEKLIQTQRNSIVDLTNQVQELKATRVTLVPAPEPTVLQPIINGVILSQPNEEFIAWVLGDKGKKWLLDRGIFTSRKDADLSTLDKDTIVNACLSFAEKQKKADDYNFQKAFHDYLNAIPKPETV